MNYYIIVDLLITDRTFNDKFRIKSKYMKIIPEKRWAVLCSRLYMQSDKSGVQVHTGSSDKYVMYAKRPTPTPTANECNACDRRNGQTKCGFSAPAVVIRDMNDIPIYGSLVVCSNCMYSNVMLQI